MSYPWTHVPHEPPPVDQLQLRMLPVADLFMALMLSRPGGLSLRTTWVTPATIWLSLVSCVLVGIASVVAVVLATIGEGVVLVAGGALGIVLAVGAGVVAVYGIRQRLLVNRRPARRSGIDRSRS